MMPIDGGLRDKLATGTEFVAKYKGTEHRCEVVTGEDGKRRFRLADGREFKSPSSAGSAVMGGTACNGWRFWSVAGASPHCKAGEADRGEGRAAQVRRLRQELRGREAAGAPRRERRTALPPRLATVSYSDG